MNSNWFYWWGVWALAMLVAVESHGKFRKMKEKTSRGFVSKSSGLVHHLHQDPILWAEKFQGDMLLTYEQVEKRFGKDVADDAQARGFISTVSGRRLGPTGEDILWQSEVDGGPAIIPYDFESSGFDASEESLITSAMDALETASNNRIEFVAKDASHSHWVRFQSSDSGCYSYVGEFTGLGSPQPINLGTGCVTFGIIQHEILHALGFYHEQSRPDRDTYVTVVDSAITAGYESQFAIENTIDSLGSTYDYDSVMHYGATDFGALLQNCPDTFSTCNVRGPIFTADSTDSDVCISYEVDGSVTQKQSIGDCLDWILEEGTLGTQIHPATDYSLCLTADTFFFDIELATCTTADLKLQSWHLGPGSDFTTSLSNIEIRVAGDPQLCVDVFFSPPQLYYCNELTSITGDQQYTFSADSTHPTGCEDISFGCDYVESGGFYETETVIVAPQAIGQRDGISDEDAYQLISLYGGSLRPTSSPVPTTPDPTASPTTPEPTASPVPTTPDPTITPSTPGSDEDGFIPGLSSELSIIVVAGGGSIIVATGLLACLVMTSTPKASPTNNVMKIEL